MGRLLGADLLFEFPVALGEFPVALAQIAHPVRGALLLLLGRRGVVPNLHDEFVGGFGLLTLLLVIDLGLLVLLGRRGLGFDLHGRVFGFGAHAFPLACSGRRSP